MRSPINTSNFWRACPHLRSQPLEQRHVLQQLRLFHAPSAGKPHQYNCTYFSAVERNPRTYLLARVIQFFTPGIPMVGVVLTSVLLAALHLLPQACALCLTCLLDWQRPPATCPASLCHKCRILHITRRQHRGPEEASHSICCLL